MARSEYAHTICPVRILRQAIRLLEDAVICPPDLIDDPEVVSEAASNNVDELLDLVKWFDRQNISNIQL